jgi:hypothetical protein
MNFHAYIYFYSKKILALVTTHEHLASIISTDIDTRGGIGSYRASVIVHVSMHVISIA